MLRELLADVYQEYPNLVLSTTSLYPNNVLLEFPSGNTLSIGFGPGHHSSNRDLDHTPGNWMDTAYTVELLASNKQGMPLRLPNFQPDGLKGRASADEVVEAIENMWDIEKEVDE